MQGFSAEGPLGSGAHGGADITFSTGPKVVNVTKRRIDVLCLHCNGQLEGNGFDDVAQCMSCKRGNLCPDCGSGNLEVTANLENGQTIYACGNCGKAGLACHRNVVFTTANANAR
jgi:hypothetical protein